MSSLIFFEGESGALEVRLDQETVWLTQEQMATLFERERSVISKHLRKVYLEEELSLEGTRAFFAQVQTEGKRTVTRQIEHYNLDAIISVGYRVNSKQGTRFRQWANRILKDYLIQGYALDRQRLARNSAELEAALKLVQNVLTQPDLAADAGYGLADIVLRYTQTYLWLQAYDDGRLDEPRGSTGGTLPEVDSARREIAGLKTDLMAKGQASPLFGQEREDGLAALLGNLEQSIFGEPAYPTLESRAAHLLYFIIKNHPFADGNKRIGAFLFAGFLHHNRRLFRADGSPVINDVGLAALCLLVAQSRPDDKDIIIRLIMNMLAGAQTP